MVGFEVGELSVCQYKPSPIPHFRLLHPLVQYALFDTYVCNTIAMM